MRDVEGAIRSNIQDFMYLCAVTVVRMSFKEQFKRLIDKCFVIGSRMSSDDKLKRLIDLCVVLKGF